VVPVDIDIDVLLLPPAGVVDLLLLEQPAVSSMAPAIVEMVIALILVFTIGSSSCLGWCLSGLMARRVQPG
jgi:hypothetical protein